MTAPLEKQRAVLQSASDALGQAAKSHSSARNYHRQRMLECYEKQNELVEWAKELGISITVQKAKGNNHGRTNP